ncbi:MAG: DUF58 domain-containing protein [Gammaproteobacteria bacterium]
MITQPLRGARVGLADLLALRFAPLPAERHAGTAQSARGGTRLSRHRGRGIDFSEVRGYAPGDDVRTIDWKVTARKGRPHTKVFREERERQTLLFIDQTQSMFFGSRVRLKSVAAAELATRIAWRAIAEQDRVGGLVVGNNTIAAHEPYRQMKPLARLLGDLARLNGALTRGDPVPDPAHMAHALLRLGRLARRHHRIYLISDFAPLGPHWADAMLALARQNEVVAIRVCDPLEAELPPADVYSITDGAARWRFDAAEPKLRADYRTRAANHASAFTALCRDAGVPGHVLSTDQTIDDALPGL